MIMIIMMISMMTMTMTMMAMMTEMDSWKEVLPRDPLCPHSTTRPSWEYEMNSEIESYDDEEEDYDYEQANVKIMTLLQWS